MPSATAHQTITAVERDGFDLRLLTLTFEVPNDSNFDLLDNIKKTCNDFIKTETGKDALEHNCGAFNLADFNMLVPNSFCEKYGFKKINEALSNIEIDWDAQLIDEPDDN